MKHSGRWILLLSVFLTLVFLHFQSGEITVSFVDIYNSIFHYNENQTAHILFLEFRLPRIIMALIAGASLAVSGMMMQSMFNNPLAGPYILGINSGASLLVAIGILSGFSLFQSTGGLIGAALIGGFLVGLLMLLLAGKVRSTIGLLLVGIMISSFIGSIISFLEAGSNAEKLRNFTLWSMGSLQHVQLNQILPILSIVLSAFAGVFLCVKPLNILVLGEVVAHSLGINTKRLNLILILLTAILAGVVTAFCGPIAFVGLAVPNVTRMLFKTRNHRILLFANLIIGSIFMLICDILILQLEHLKVIPINVLTSFIGAPFVIYVVFKSGVR